MSDRLHVNLSQNTVDGVINFRSDNCKGNKVRVAQYHQYIYIYIYIYIYVKINMSTNTPEK